MCMNVCVYIYIYMYIHIMININHDNIISCVYNIDTNMMSSSNNNNNNTYHRFVWSDFARDRLDAGLSLYI